MNNEACFSFRYRAYNDYMYQAGKTICIHDALSCVIECGNECIIVGVSAYCHAIQWVYRLITHHTRQLFFRYILCVACFSI
jgi:hypothetical protein